MTHVPTSYIQPGTFSHKLLSCATQLFSQQKEEVLPL